MTTPSPEFITLHGRRSSLVLELVPAALAQSCNGQPNPAPVSSGVKDVITGLLISAPVFWMFTKFLAINLPGLTETGWL